MTVDRWTTYQLWYGRDEAPATRHELRAGPVSAVLDGRDLRNVRIGGIQIVDRVYVALRDRNWGTVPGAVSNLVIDATDDQFTVTFDVAHRQGDLDVTWRGQITGTPEGVITYAMDAVAGADITYKLLGLNSHHGMAEYAGNAYEGETPEGPIAGAFPLRIAPQMVEDATEVPIFPALSSLTARLATDFDVTFDFAGDLFEWEDQRNWTDASFKAQSLPPRRNGFYQAKAGEHIHQSMTISSHGTSPSPPAREEIIRVTLGAPSGRALPAIGLGMASHGEPLSEREAALLRALRLDHLRVDLPLVSAAWKHELARAIEASRALDCPLELAITLSDNASDSLAELAAALKRDQPQVCRVLVFHEHEGSTSPKWLNWARGRLGPIVPGALFAGGTNANFCELNRGRWDLAPDEGVVYSINPQVHAFDEASLVENLAAQAETVRSAQAIAADRPVIVSPVTLKPRFNAVATEAEAEPAPGELPGAVDPRQMSLFGAGWTLGSIKALAESGAESVTYYETTGWRGVIETDAGSPDQSPFPSAPGVVFPLYHVFADLAEWRGGEIVPARSDEPLVAECLAIRSNGVLHLLLANHTSVPRRVVLTPIRTNRIAVRRLNEQTAPIAITRPERFRNVAEPQDVSGDELIMTLAPFEVACLDEVAE